MALTTTMLSAPFLLSPPRHCNPTTSPGGEARSNPDAAKRRNNAEKETKKGNRLLRLSPLFFSGLPRRYAAQGDEAGGLLRFARNDGETRQ
jgi:hypothetical protein